MKKCAVAEFQPTNRRSEYTDREGEVDVLTRAGLGGAFANVPLDMEFVACQSRTMRSNQVLIFNKVPTSFTQRLSGLM